MNETIVEASYDEKQVRKYYSWRASNYDYGTGYEMEHHVEAVQLGEIKEGHRVLDAACGTGRATVELAKAVGRTGEVNALELSDVMLRRARAKVNQAALPNVFFTQGSVKDMPYPDESFDVVYNGYMFDLIARTEFVPILQEFKRVLKPGGELVLVNMSKPDSRKTIFEKIYEKGLPVGPCRPVIMVPYLEQAGFENIHRLYRPNHGFSLARLWGTEIVLGGKSVPKPVVAEDLHHTKFNVKNPKIRLIPNTVKGKRTWQVQI